MPSLGLYQNKLLPLHQRNTGFTLIELMVVIAIIGILFSLATTGVGRLLSAKEAHTEFEQLQQLIFSTRSNAVLRLTSTTLCPLGPDNRCMRDWNGPLTAFEDTNRNRELDNDERIIQQIPGVVDSGHRAYTRRNVTGILFDPRGFAGGSNGSLSYCIKNGEGQRGSVLILSRNGRIRAGADTNQNGLPELPSNNDIPCP